MQGADAPDSATTMIGEVVGAYRIVERTGSWSMGTVYLAEHRHLGRRAAVKVLQPGWSSDEQLVARFFEEARGASLIEHPGIVQVFDCDMHARTGQAYIVMEHLAGMTLRQRLDADRRPAPQRWVLRVARAIAEPLAAAHDKGIFHRNLKPESIFLVNRSPEEAVKVLDFGMAKVAAATRPDRGGTLASTTPGAVRYLSPEQCRGKGTIDGRTDIYSLGCLLFEMLCGRPPFASEGVAELLMAHLNEVPLPVSSLVPDVSRGLSTLVAMMLAKKSGERPSSMQEVITLLDSVPQSSLEGMPTTIGRLATTLILPSSPRPLTTTIDREPALLGPDAPTLAAPPATVPPPAAPSQRHDRPQAAPSQRHAPPRVVPPARHDPPSARHDPPSARHDPPSVRHDPPSVRHDPPARVAATARPAPAARGVPLARAAALPRPAAPARPEPPPRAEAPAPRKSRIMQLVQGARGPARKAARGPQKPRNTFATGTITWRGLDKASRSRQLLMAVPLIAAAVGGVFLVRDKVADRERAARAAQNAAPAAAPAPPLPAGPIAASARFSRPLDQVPPPATPSNPAASPPDAAPPR
jgi:serine/threonine protein kinase